MAQGTSHQLKFEGTGAATYGHCSCGLWADAAAWHTKNRRKVIRLAHDEHIRLVERAARLERGEIE